MGRPIYENEESLKAEQEMREVISSKWKVEAMKVPIRYKVDDYLLRDGDVVAIVEYKKRNMSSTCGKSLFISAEKIYFGRAYAEQAGVPFFMIFKFTDGLFFLNASEYEFKIGINGRRDRGDSQDIEPVGYIDKTKLRRINE